MISTVQFTYRPLAGVWPSDGSGDYKSCRFRMSWSKTMDLLRYELGRLDVGEAVIEADFKESEIRLDGLPYVNARAASSRVRLSFKHPQTQIGHLQYPCDTFENWQNNILAIAKTLEVQRAMDRYGATRNFEQYAGWKQLGSGGVQSAGGSVPMTHDRALEVISSRSGADRLAIASDSETAKRAYRQAAMRSHPDRGGSEEAFKKVATAWEVLKRQGWTR